jgi:uncharacterized membrane protein
MENFRNFMILTLGVFIGAVIFSVVRVFQYKWLGLQPGMAPEMFVIFSPVLALPVAMIAVVVHYFFRNSFKYQNPTRWFFAGVIYSSILLLLVSPWLLLIVAIAYYFFIRTGLPKPIN